MSSVERYDPVHNLWQTVAKLPRLVLRVLVASPDWLSVVLTFGSGLDPPEGIARLGLSLASPQGGCCLQFARSAPS